MSPNESPWDGEAGVSGFMRALFITSTGLWAGSGVLFSAVVLPSLFLNLETSDAGRIAALLFPGYYLFGVVLGLAVIASAAYFAKVGARRWRVVLVAATIATACHGYAALDLRPRMVELRGDPHGTVEFQRLHKLSVRLNGVVLIVSIGLLVGAANLVERR